MKIEHNKDYYWNKILSIDTAFGMVKLAGERSGDTDLENSDTINNFFIYLRENINYKFVVVTAMKWHEFSEEKQVNIAISTVGVLYASRFLMLLDYLSVKYQEGKLV